jgi:hypothetical protein
MGERAEQGGIENIREREKRLNSLFPVSPNIPVPLVTPNP